MSGSAFAQVPMGVQVINPWKGVSDYNAAQASYLAPAQAAATVGETQARAGLLGQQAIGANLANQLTGLALPFQASLYGMMSGGAGASSYSGSADDVLASGGQYPQPQAPAGAGGDGSGGGAIGTYATTTAPVASPDGGVGTPPPGPVGSTPLPAPGVGGAPLIGGNLPPNTPRGYAPPGSGLSVQQGAATGGGQSGLPPRFTGANGVLIPGMAFPVPRAWLPGYIQAQDKGKAIEQMMQNRQLALRQRIMGTLNSQGQVDPDAWNVAVKQAFNDGLIDNADLVRYYGHGNLEPAMLNQNLAPEQNAQIQGAIAGARAGAEVGPHVAEAGGKAAAELPYQVALEKAKQQIAAGYDFTDVPIKNADGSYSTKRMSRAQAAQVLGGGGGGGQTGAAYMGGETPMTGSAYADAVKGRENPGGNPYAPNASGPGGTPTSTAVGDHQFVDGTWLTEMKRYRPDLTAGQTDAQILAMRGDPALSSEMAQHYAVENAGALRQAGMPVNAATLALAHGFGPAGAARIMQANTNAPLSTVLTAQELQANPQYAKMTAGQLLSGFVNRFGRGPVDFGNIGGGGGGPTPVQVAGPGAPTASAPAPTPAAGAAGAGGPSVGVSAPTIPPALQPIISAETDQIKEDRSTVQGVQGAAYAAGRAQMVLRDEKGHLPNVPSGSLGDERAAISNFLKTFGGPWANNFAAWASGHNIDPKNAGEMQQFIKQAFNTTASAEASSGGGATGASVRIGAMLTQFFQKAMPNINMQKGAISDMINFMLVGNQMARDYAERAANHFNGQYNNWRGNPIQNRYDGLTNFDAKWDAADSVSSPQSYEGAALLLNGKAGWASGLSDAQKHEAIKIATRADPSARFKAEMFK